MALLNAANKSLYFSTGCVGEDGDAGRAERGGGYFKEPIGHSRSQIFYALILPLFRSPQFHYHFPFTAS